MAVHVQSYEKSLVALSGRSHAEKQNYVRHGASMRLSNPLISMSRKNHSFYKKHIMVVSEKESIIIVVFDPICTALCATSPPIPSNFLSLSSVPVHPQNSSA